MGYYGRGDYYRGDYYRGDLWGSIKKIGGKVLGAAASFVPGGGLVKGAVKTGIGLLAGKGAETITRGLLGGGQGGRTSPTTMPRIDILPGPGFIDPLSILPGGQPFAGVMGGNCNPGFHLDKRSRQKCVRNRTMNAANPKALRRAIRREKAFVALARRTLAGTGITIGRSKSFGGRKRKR